MTFKPIADRVLVKRTDAAEKTAGGIYIPDNVREKPVEGEVIEVGEGYRNESGTVLPMEVKKGDRILFGKFAGTEIKLGNDTFLIMKENEILGILTA